ncbi:MAG: transglutaminase domain-containing protein [Lachnospiraceae bacterium]
MKTQDITSHGVTYFIERNGHVLGRRKGSRYMAPDGRKLNKKQTAELRAYQNARKVVARITTSDMTDAEKLQRCFVWMQSNGFATQGRLSSGGKFWYAFNANQLFMRRRGNCIPYACAMAYMAKVIGYKEVYICSRGTKQQSFHTWTEINGVVYDSYFANRRDADKYYGIKYNDFEYGVVFRQKLPEKYS